MQIFFDLHFKYLSSKYRTYKPEDTSWLGAVFLAENDFKSLNFLRYLCAQ